MTRKTPHYGLQILGTGDDFFADGSQFSDADRALIDNLLYMGASGHHHDGQVPDIIAPGSALVPHLVAGGRFAAGARVFYKFTFVDQDGFESSGSPELSVTFPNPLGSPSAPQLSTSPTGGSPGLAPGSYYYVLSWYQGWNTVETVALNPSFITIPAGGAAPVISFPLPALVAGADGLNVYRRGPGDAGYLHLASIAMTGTSPPSTFTDNGSYEVDCNRGPSSTDLTNGGNAVELELPGNIDVPRGITWNLYRSTQSGIYTTALLATGIEGSTYLDTGAATANGGPPAQSNIPSSPARIQLTDGDEVQGTLPMGLVAGFPVALPFVFQGPLSAAIGQVVWPCPFPQAQIVGVQAALGVGSSPAAQPVIVDVNIGRGPGRPASYASIFGEAGLPQIAVGQQVSSMVAPLAADASLAAGDQLTVDLDQAGGGSVPTDHDLTVIIYLFVYGFPTTSFEPLVAPAVGQAQLETPSDTDWAGASDAGAAGPSATDTGAGSSTESHT